MSYVVAWRQSGCVVLGEWCAPISSGSAASGTAFWIKYKTPKGKEMEMIKYVKWDYTYTGESYAYAQEQHYPGIKCVCPVCIGEAINV